ncbi:helix-turn-helix domain-containing protein [Microbacterium sp. CFBP 8794]
MSQASISRAAELHAQGLSFRKIAITVGYDARTVATTLRARGIAK